MWRNYLTVGFRALAKNRTYAFINIIGLAIGLAACLLILLYVRYENSFENWVPDADRVFQVQTVQRNPQTGETTEMQAATEATAAALKKDFPQIEAISRVLFAELSYMDQGEARNESIVRVDEPFLTMIGAAFIHGDPKTALRDENALVLTRSRAEALFGTADILGRTLTATDGNKDLRVTGVIEDLPKNSHMDFSIFGKARPARDCWGCIGGYVYGKIRPGADLAAMNDALPAWERRNVPSNVGDGPGGNVGKDTDWRLVSIPAIHLGSAQIAAPRPGNDPRTIATFAIIAILILGMACVNFTNLATARASQRAREVALRKVLGASRGQLIGQFLGESLLIATLAMMLALAIAEVAMPALSAFLDADLRMQYIGRDSVLPAILGLVAAVGLAGGLYPAFLMSGFRPAAVLRANKSSADAQGSGRLRNLLVVGQFAISITLIICTAIVYTQTLFAQNSDPGFRRDGLLQISYFDRVRSQGSGDTLKAEIARLEGVTGVAATQIVSAGPQVRRTDAFAAGNAEPVELGIYSVDPEFFATAELRILAGRVLRTEIAKDNASIAPGPDGAPSPEREAALAERGANIVLTELAAERLGFGSPAGAVGQTLHIAVAGPGQRLASTVVGVVANPRFRSIRDPAEPLILINQGDVSDLIVRFEGDRPEDVRQRVGETWKKVAPQIPFEAAFADQEVADLYEAERARAETFAGFAILAVVIACLGLFGLAAFTAERRTKEIGIRKVLGARVGDVVRLLTWQFSKPVLLANVIAWPIAWWLMRDWLNEFDARIDLTPAPFAAAGMIALVIAIATIAGHAIRVARANPINALRYE